MGVTRHKTDHIYHPNPQYDPHPPNVKGQRVPHSCYKKPKGPMWGQLDRGPGLACVQAPRLPVDKGICSIWAMRRPPPPA